MSYLRIPLIVEYWNLDHTFASAMPQNIRFDHVSIILTQPIVVAPGIYKIVTRL